MCLILLYWYEKSLPKDLQKYYDLNCSDWIEKIRSVCDMIGLQKSFHDNFSVVKPSGMGQNTSNDMFRNKFRHEFKESKLWRQAQ